MLRYDRFLDVPGFFHLDPTSCSASQPVSVLIGVVGLYQAGGSFQSLQDLRVECHCMLPLNTSGLREAGTKRRWEAIALLMGKHAQETQLQKIWKCTGVNFLLLFNMVPCSICFPFHNLFSHISHIILPYYAILLSCVLFLTLCFTVKSRSRDLQGKGRAEQIRRPGWGCWPLSRSSLADATDLPSKGWSRNQIHRDFDRFRQ